MNITKINSIRKQIKAARPADTADLFTQLLAAIDEDNITKGFGIKSAGITNQLAKTCQPQPGIESLRNMLTWPEVRSNPLATARIARTIREMRESE
jgi:hypothetical protein